MAQLFMPNLMTGFFTPRRLSWALLLTLPLWFGACKKNTDVTPSSSAIQGSWRITAYTIDPAFDLTGTGTKTNDLLSLYAAIPGGQQIVDCFKSVTITFNADGKLTGSTTPACSNTSASPIENNSTWSLNGNKLRISDSSGSEDYDVSINGNTLKLSQTEVKDYDGDGKTESGTVSLVLTKA